MSAMMSILRGEELRLMNRYTHANTGLWQVYAERGAFRFELENDTAHLNAKHQ